MKIVESSVNSVGFLLKDHLQRRSERKRLAMLCGITIFVVLSATLWPFNLFPTNRVSWLSETNGIRFGRSGVVISDAPLTTGGGFSSSCSLEILLRPADVESVHTILSFYTPKNPRQLLVGQSGTALLISHAFAEFAGLDHFFRQGQLVFVTMTSGPSGTVVYKDGRQVEVFSGFRILPNDLSGEMVMGNSAVDLKPWQGELRGLAIYSRELSSAEVLRDYHNWIDGYGAGDSEGATARYAFTERAGRVIHNTVVSGPNLEIPKWFEVPGKGFLTSPAKDFEASWDYGLDLLENIVGFVPLGFIICAYLATTRSQRRAILYTAVSAGILSLAIEVLQWYIPPRGSNVTDIITNTLGAFCGALLARPRIVQAFLERTQWRRKAAEKLSDQPNS